jgi:hypothetical protein
VALMLGGYLAICLYQGNLGALASAAKDDFLGTAASGNAPAQPGFWRWAVALLILVALARSPRTNFLFGPLLIFTLVAMLISTASNQPAAWANINAGIAKLFGRNSTPAGSGIAIAPGLAPSATGVLPNG